MERARKKKKNIKSPKAFNIKKPVSKKNVKFLFLNFATLCVLLILLLTGHFYWSYVVWKLSISRLAISDPTLQTAAQRNTHQSLE